jgi:dephospho-CoA kinase
VFAGKPIIGIVGGIGSGKTFVAGMFEQRGCVVIHSDEQVRQVYKDYRVKQTLRKWWGPMVFGPDGEVDRAAVARKVFSKPEELRRLEGLVHPLVDELRQRAMQTHADNAQVVAFVWDTPLLIEAGLNRHCDAVVYVDAPLELRVQRVRESRGWDQAELESREKSQTALDSKRKISDYVISNTAGPDQVRAQVDQVLSRILAGTTPSNDVR